jgi:hypothetical protein
MKVMQVTLPVPNLDDRTFTDLVADAREDAHCVQRGPTSPSTTPAWRWSKRSRIHRGRSTTIKQLPEGVHRLSEHARHRPARSGGGGR